MEFIDLVCGIGGFHQAIEKEKINFQLKIQQEKLRIENQRLVDLKNVCDMRREHEYKLLNSKFQNVIKKINNLI